MSITIDATSGGASANSFVTEAEAIAYAATRLAAGIGTGSGVWTTVSGSTCTETEKAALIEATREITVREFVGQRSTSTQALSWPRLWAPNPDAQYWNWYLTTAIPQRVKDATCELAIQFLKAGTTDLAALDSTNNIARRRVDVLETEYVQPSQRAKGLGRFPRVLNLLRPLLAQTSAGMSIVRG